MNVSKDKLKRLDDRIKSFKDSAKKTPHKSGSNTSLAFNIAVELTAGMIVGTLIGIFFDKMFDSKPAFLIICLMLSATAAFKSIWKKYINKNGS